MRTASSSGPIRLLVVDDEPDVQALFELRFRSEIRTGAFDLRFASNGAEAVDVVADDPGIEVVVTDLNMPGMSGLELLARLDALDFPLKTIVLTAYGDMANIRTAMMNGAFDFQIKPLDIDDLRTTIRKASAIVRELRAGREAQRRAAELERRNTYLTDVFGRYVSDDVVHRLLESPDGVELAGERRELTLMLADIRGFSRLSKRLPPEQIVHVLNSYLDLAVEIILARGGTINEILGDGLLVFFGAPIPDPAAAEHAVAAAIELQLAMASLNERHRDEGLPELAIGIAIHTGPVVVGTIGSSRRLKYTAVGPDVNVVGRIESYARGGQILVSEATLDRVQELVTVTGSFRVKAKGEESGDLAVHVVRGLGGRHRLELPTSSERLHAVGEPVGAAVARVVDDRIGDEVSCELVAIGREAARVRTATMFAPLDDVVLRVAAEELYGRVSESVVTNDGAHLLTIVYNAAAGDALDHLREPEPSDVGRARGHQDRALRRTVRAPLDRRS